MGACNCNSQHTEEAQFTLEDREKQKELVTKFHQLKVTKPKELVSLISEDFKYWNLGPSGAPCCGYWEEQNGYLQDYTVETLMKQMTIYSQDVKENYCSRNVMISVLELGFSTKEPKLSWTKEKYT
eukprot:CAMPEP_0176414890 /NCGR_PEP_ID=MMETSP0127-20121128/5509_1 /TAXON_ID=938130 /ORGANISM="Platyophrya macrostoma, Strain WH" /LENGTH=125 /DNA_ID=CAMNT_0017794839 /DNA_START=33 /DNA_END=406 /DNA_ORIENTATION=-